MLYEKNKEKTQMVNYNRIMLKLSGEALMGNQKFGIDAAVLKSFALQIAENLVFK